MPAVAADYRHRTCRSAGRHRTMSRLDQVGMLGLDLRQGAQDRGEVVARRGAGADRVTVRALLRHRLLRRKDPDRDGRENPGRWFLTDAGIRATPAPGVRQA